MDQGKEARRIFTAGKLIDVFDDDIFLVSYPRSGNLWLRWLLAVSVKGRLDVSNPVISRIVPDIYEVSNEYLLALEKPRVIKSHEKYNAAYPKVIYLYRDVRDVMISFFHYLKRGGGDGTDYDFNTYFDLFTAGRLYSTFGTWEENVCGWFGRRNQIAFIRYEDLLADTRSVLAKALRQISADFREELLDSAVELGSFKRMYAMERVNRASHGAPETRLVRKGTSGQWRDYLSPAQIDAVKRRYGPLLIKLGYESSYDW